MTDTAPTNFIRQIIDDDMQAGRNRVVTRFPPEPNGYLHIGHAKSLCLNFGTANAYPNGECYLRFDDTNPSKEDVEYVEAIKDDVRWLGFDWGERLTHASDYFERLYAFAVELIEKDKAYVCSLSAEEIREYRGTLKEPGRDSPYRTRTVAENLQLFAAMRAGDFADGTHVVRAKIDMASPNINMRDPVIYRIMHQAHPMTGDAWCIYPMYDFTHCLSDALEGITHSLCTLEFEDHRPLYNWFLEQLDTTCHPRQIEFSRLSLSHTVTSKRLLNQLIGEGYVSGWDDPRMPTLVGLRRRGYTPAALRNFCDLIGITKSENNVDMAVLENCIREDLDKTAPRVMAVLNPLKVVIDNYPADQVEHFEGLNHPADESFGKRSVAFSREIYIERDDFMETPPRKFFRLSPGREVRLRYAYYVTCTDIIKDADGEVVEVHCTYDPQSRGGWSDDGRKVKGTLHWVCAKTAIPLKVHLYDRLFGVTNPSGAESYVDCLNPQSDQVLDNCFGEAALGEVEPGARYQFERLGYFCKDSKSEGAPPVFNRTVSLRDSWAKIEASAKTKAKG